MAVWTAFALIALWGLMQIKAARAGPTSWVFQAGDSLHQSWGQRARNWFLLADFNFQRIYPWVLLGPYVAWVGTRFALERGRLRINLPVHLAGCVGFILISHAINDQTANRVERVVIITSQTNIEAQPGTNMVHIEVSKTAADQLFKQEVIRFRSENQHLHEPPDFLYVQGASMHAGTTNLLPVLDKDFKVPRFPPDMPATLRPLGILLDFFAYGAIVGVAHSVHFYRRYRERERRALFLESTLAKARLSALQTQLQPHFLFNSLNAIATLLRRDPHVAEATLMALSDLLRLTLSQSEKQEVTLREELQCAQSYLEIQQTRFGDRLRFEKVIQPATLDCLVPTLLFQPLIENAIRHGIEPSENAGVVRLIAEEKGGRLMVAVEDNGIGLKNKREMPLRVRELTPPKNRGAGENLTAARDPMVPSEKVAARPGTGIGLSNLRARLEALYGVHHQIDILERSGGGIFVRIEIPWRTVQLPAPELVADQR